MRKNIIFIITIFLLIFSFSGCSKQEIPKTAQEAVKLLNEKVDTSANDIEFDADYSMELNVDSNIIQMNMEYNGNIKFKSKDGKPQYYMSMETNSMGMEIDMLMVMADGKAYYEMNGVRTEMEIDELEDMFNSSIETNIAEDDVKSFTIRKDGDNTIFEIILDTDNISGIANNLLDDLEFGGEFKYNECKTTIIIDKKGNPVNYEMIANFIAEVYGMTSEFDVKMEMKFNSFEDVKIDLSKLQEM